MNGKDVKHEYLYHSIGQGFDVMNIAGQKLPLSPTTELSSKAGDLKGYDYFENKKATQYSGNFAARFNINLEKKDDVAVDMWMKGYPERTIFNVMSPKSNAFVKGSIPDELLGKQLPTLIVRQKGEAWNRPFVAVYHPYAVAENSSVKKVEYFGNSGDFVGIAVQSSSRTDYVFNSASGEPDVTYRDMRFKGNYAVISEADGVPVFLFLGEGQFLALGKWSIVSKDAGVQVSLTRSGNDCELFTSGDITITVPVSGDRQPELSKFGNANEKLQGTLSDGIFKVEIPSGKYNLKF
jgi:hypothetical protein